LRILGINLLNALFIIPVDRLFFLTQMTNHLKQYDRSNPADKPTLPKCSPTISQFFIRPCPFLQEGPGNQHHKQNAATYRGKFYQFVQTIFPFSPAR
jgi:hypothetical protein